MFNTLRVSFSAIDDSLACSQPERCACQVSEGSVEEQPLSSKAQQLTKGLGKFVSQIMDMYKSGFDSRRMLLQQSLAKVAAPPPPFSPPPPVCTLRSAGMGQEYDYR